MKDDFLSVILEAANIYFEKLSCGGYEKLKDGLEGEVKAALIVKQGKASGENHLAKDGIIREGALLCKKAGVYPYYTSKLAAAALFCEGNEDIKISNSIALLGIRSATEEIMEFILEPELSYMISREYVCILEDTFFDIDEKKLALLKEGYERGFLDEAQHGGCAQCTVKAFFETVDKQGEKEEYLFKAASGMAGGIAGCCDSACGAYSASIMILSTYVGRELCDLDEKDGKTAKKSNKLGQIIHDKFEDVYGSNECREIHVEKFGESFDFRIYEDRKAFNAAGAHDDKCPSTVGLATTWLIEVLYDNNLI